MSQTPHTLPTTNPTAGTAVQVPPSLERAHTALRDARRVRGEWLLNVTDGIFTPLDLIAEAATDEGRPLRKLELRQVLLAQPGWGTKRTAETLTHLASRTGADPSFVKHATVAWLIDVRAAGHRILAWLDVTHAKQSPWPGFPFAPAPRLAAGRRASAHVAQHTDPAPSSGSQGDF